MSDLVRPKALLFDMDGLLLDTESATRDSFSEITAEFGINKSTSDEFFLTLVGTSSAVTREMVSRFVPEADLAAFGKAWDVAMARRLADSVPLRPQVASVLDDLTRTGYRMAVVTSTAGDRARKHLEVAGIKGHFDRVLGGDEVSANKPDPAPYIEAAAHFGALASDCVAFEDSDRGILSAAAAGCRSVQIPDLRPENTPFPDVGQLISRDLREAVAELGLLN